MVQVTQVQYEPLQQSGWTQMHTSQVHFVDGKSVEDIDYGGGLSCINWEANFKQSEATFDLEQSNLGNVDCVFVVGNFLALGDFRHIKLDYMSLGLLNTIHFMNTTGNHRRVKGFPIVVKSTAVYLGFKLRRLFTVVVYQ
ncbi:unnamed protein product [Prunus armeniaca]